MQAPARQLLALLLAASFAAFALTGTASASSAGVGQASASASKQSSAHKRSRARVRPTAAAKRRARAHRRLARIRRRRAHRRSIGVQNGVALTARASENPEVLFRGDFDEGFDAWHLQSLAGRATLTSSGAFQGVDAARFEVRDGDVEPETGSQRSEVSGPTFSEGEDLYIRDAIRVPSGNTYEGPWQIIQQLHEEDWNGSPGVALFLDSKRRLTLGPGDSSRTFWESGSLQSDRWYDLVYRVNLSQDPGAGFVEVWLDGAQQSLANGQTRIYGQTMQTDETYLKAGIYRSKSSTGTSIVEHDAIVVGTSYSAVTAG